MDIFYLSIALIIIFSCKFLKLEFNKEALERKNTLCISGIFVILVFFRHIADYININTIPSNFYNIIDPQLGQTIVTPFLFYSGYGIFECIKNKENYINNKFKTRIKKLYSNLLIAIITYLIMNTFLKIKYNTKTILLSLLAFESIGNSNWYIFSILVLYLITYINFKLIKDKKCAILSTTLFTIIFTIILMFLKEDYYYNTIISYIFGLWFSYYKDKIISIITTNNYIYTLILLIDLINLYTFNKLHLINTFYYYCYDIAFIILIILLSLKFKINNKFLLFLGSHTFWIYILQRITMITLNKLNINTYLYIILSFITTIILSIIYENIFNKKIKKLA